MVLRRAVEIPECCTVLRDRLSALVHRMEVAGEVIEGYASDGGVSVTVPSRAHLRRVWPRVLAVIANPPDEDSDKAHDRARVRSNAERQKLKKMHRRGSRPEPPVLSSGRSGRKPRRAW